MDDLAQLRDMILLTQKNAVGDLSKSDSEAAFARLNELHDMLLLHLNSTRLLTQHIQDGHFQNEIDQFEDWLSTLP